MPPAHIASSKAANAALLAAIDDANKNPPAVDDTAKTWVCYVNQGKQQWFSGHVITKGKWTIVLRPLGHGDGVPQRERQFTGNVFPKQCCTVSTVKLKARKAYKAGPTVKYVPYKVSRLERGLPVRYQALNIVPTQFTWHDTYGDYEWMMGVPAYKDNSMFVYAANLGQLEKGHGDPARRPPGGGSAAINVHMGHGAFGVPTGMYDAAGRPVPFKALNQVFVFHGRVDTVKRILDRVFAELAFQIADTAECALRWTTTDGVKRVFFPADDDLRTFGSRIFDTGLPVKQYIGTKLRELPKKVHAARLDARRTGDWDAANWPVVGLGMESQVVLKQPLTRGQHGPEQLPEDGTRSQLTSEAEQEGPSQALADAALENDDLVTEHYSSDYDELDDEAEVASA